MIRVAFLLTVVLGAPLAAAAAPSNFAELVKEVLTIVNAGTGLLIAAGLVIYFWGISVNILKFESDPDKKKIYFFWGLLVLFVMVSVWGIVGLLRQTLFGESLLIMTGGAPAETRTMTPGGSLSPWRSYSL